MASINTARHSKGEPCLSDVYTPGVLTLLALTGLAIAALAGWWTSERQ